MVVEQGNDLIALFAHLRFVGLNVLCLAIRILGVQDAAHTLCKGL